MVGGAGSIPGIILTLQSVGHYNSKLPAKSNLRKILNHSQNRYGMKMCYVGHRYIKRYSPLSAYSVGPPA